MPFLQEAPDKSLTLPRLWSLAPVQSHPQSLESHCSSPCSFLLSTLPPLASCTFCFNNTQSIQYIAVLASPSAFSRWIPVLQGQLTQDLLYAPEYHVCTLSTVLTVSLCSLLWGLLRAGSTWSHMCLAHLCSLMPAELGKERTLLRICRTLREGRDEVMSLNSRL